MYLTGTIQIGGVLMIMPWTALFGAALLGLLDDRGDPDS
jgi:hypothetical protein